jgi:hypothetical protein
VVFGVMLMRRRGGLLAAVLGVAACGPAFWGQDDGFRAGLPASCATTAQCGALETAARTRVDECAPNTIGKVRCDDAQRDLAHVQAMFKIVKEQDAQRKQSEMEKREALETAARDEAFKAEQRKRTIREWLHSARPACERAMSPAHCEQAPDGATDEDRHACNEECSAGLDRAKDGVRRRALTSCVDRVAITDGRDPPICRFMLPDGATERLTDQADACSAECAANAKPILERKRDLAEEPASKPRKASSGGGGGSSLLCCDGSISPTCACPGHRGCCSHHGGVCGCR